MRSPATLTANSSSSALKRQIPTHESRMSTVSVGERRMKGVRERRNQREKGMRKMQEREVLGKGVKRKEN